MNIIEAVKTGKPFRRQGYSLWIIKGDPFCESYVYCHSSDGKLFPNPENPVRLTYEALTAEDYEVLNNESTGEREQPHMTDKKFLELIKTLKVFGYDLERGFISMPAGDNKNPTIQDVAKKLREIITRYDPEKQDKL